MHLIALSTATPASAATPRKESGGGFAFVLLILFLCGRAYYARHHVPTAPATPVLKSAALQGNDVTWMGLQPTRRPAVVSPFGERSLGDGLAARPALDGMMGPSLLPTPVPTTGRSSR